MKITNIEQVDHFKFISMRIEMYVVRYASERKIRYWNESHLPKTVKAFLRTHYNECIDTEKYTCYRYKAYNIIK